KKNRLAAVIRLLVLNAGLERNYSWGSKYFTPLLLTYFTREFSEPAIPLQAHSHCRANHLENLKSEFL
ncbi:hypothetical protein, partial [Leclercia adecarboxylata]|uniref:hypothetical protein n=1 Tax=Leclercia adecarboxylata TaxID=83655 RepID=UPI0029496642